MNEIWGDRVKDSTRMGMSGVYELSDSVCIKGFSYGRDIYVLFYFRICANKREEEVL